LQSPKMNVREAASDLDALARRFSDERTQLCTNSFDEGMRIALVWNISTERRVRRKKKQDGEQSADASLTLASEIDRVLKCAIDTLVIEIDTRSKRLNDLNSKFGFLLDVQTMFDDEDFDRDLLQQQCSDFTTAYEGDVDACGLQQEILDCRMLFHKRLQSPGDMKFSTPRPQTPEQLLEAAVQYGKDVFPNLRTALQIMLTVAVSVASCERSFSKLKLIKTYLRSSMKQERLSDLALLSIEKAMFDSIDYSTIIDRFADNKARRVIL
jgi:hypothetical protein